MERDTGLDSCHHFATEVISIRETEMKKVLVFGDFSAPPMEQRHFLVLEAIEAEV